MAKSDTDSKDRATGFTEKVKRIIKKVPSGKVATYGQVAAMAGNPRAARQVVRVLHACSDKDKLPWQRIVNSGGGISLKRGQGYELQKAMLEGEGIRFDTSDRIDLARHQWAPRKLSI